jgi:hypothetical protein
VERPGSIDPAVSALFGPFFRSSWRFEFISPWNAAAIQREDAKAQRANFFDLAIESSCQFSPTYNHTMGLSDLPMP